MIRRFILLIFILLAAEKGANAQINFGSSSSFKYLKGKDASAISANWMANDYTPSGWTVGNMPFRYGLGTGGTLLDDMQNNYSSVFLLSSFTAQNITQLKDVFFSVNFEDGFVIWINGEEVFSFNAPDDRAYNGLATDQRFSGTFESYQLPAHDIELKEGENQIAIQCFNVSKESSGFYFDLKINAEPASAQPNDSLKVVFSQPHGFFTSAFSLKLDVPNQAYTILYTIDGSNPQTSATAMNGGKSKTLTIDPALTNGRAKTPCFIVRASLKKDGFNPLFPLTQTYIFLSEVVKQSNPGGNWPTKTLINDQMIDLQMDPDITQSSKYSGLMNGALTDIPSISVTTEMKDLFDQTTGIYVNAMKHGENWERFSSVELIDPSGKSGFNINAGLRIRGGWSRHGNYPKHAFRLFFRDEYGAAKLKFPLFENEGTDEYDKIDLRCEQNYSWANGDSKNTCVREVFSRDTQRDMGQPYTRSRYYHLYLNGMYWGLYQTQERSEARYAADYFGGSNEDYDVIKVNSEGYGVEATDGNMNSWQKLYNLCYKGFSYNADYFALEGKDQNGIPKRGGEVMVNIDNLIDYMQVIFYTGNFDAPTSAFMSNIGPNNFYAIDKRDDRSTGYTFYAHDSEHTMMVDAVSPGIGLSENRVQIPGMAVNSLTAFHPQWLHYRLSSNREYRQRFADRAYKNFFNNGVFVPELVTARFRKRAEEIKKAIIGESARWGDAQSWTANNPCTFDTWQNAVNDVYNRFIPFRTNIVLTQLKIGGLYPNFNPPIYNKDNVTLDRDVYNVSGNYQVVISGATGQIFYTLDGTDPRLIGDQISSSAKEITTGGTLNLKGTAILNSRIKSGDKWSALASVKFMNLNEDYKNLKITELHYHPTDSLAGAEIVSGKSFEFIELKNVGDQPISLAGLKFTSSIEYQFNETDVLAPKQFYVIASKPKWFYERHFMVPSGNFGKNFSNSGEKVVVAKSDGSPIIDFTYNISNPWALKPNGNGFSLSTVLRNPAGNPADPTYWTSSTVFDGTPFRDDPGIIDTTNELNSGVQVVTVFPNPTKGLLYLKVENANSVISAEIHSLSGSLIYKTTLIGNSVINLADLNMSTGIYLVSTKCNETNTVNKVIYQR